MSAYEGSGRPVPAPRPAEWLPVDEYDGPTLRSVRESVAVPLRRVARLAGMSHGHLSKVERGEHGRPVTPAILAAYEKATGVRLTGGKVVGFGDPTAGASGADWRRGRLSDARRRGFNATIAAVAVGGPVGEPITRMIDALGRTSVPQRLTTADVAQVEHAARLVTREDLRSGGGLISQLARTVLRWAVGLTAATMTSDVNRRLHAAIGQLAHRAAWAAFDADAHDAARNLFTVALDAAIQARDRSLRAHVLADVGAQHNFLGYPDDCLEIAGLAEGDQRVGPAVRMAIHTVKARAHAAADDLASARRHIRLAEESFAAATGPAATATGWAATFSTAAHLYARTGHAAAVLARRSGEEADREDARQRLTRAVEAFDPATHHRALALCAARLAHLCLDAEEYEPAAHWTRSALDALPEVRSARLVRQIRGLRRTVAARTDQPAVELAAAIDAVVGADAASAPADPQTRAGTNGSSP